MHWFLYSITGAILIGIFVALFKIPAHKGYKSLPVLLFSFLTSGVAAIIFFHGSFKETSTGVLVCALLWGLSFAVASAVQMHALRHIDVAVLSPLTAALGLSVTVVLGTFFFKDAISFAAWCGITLVILTILFLSEKGEKDESKFFGAGGVMVLVIVGLGVFTTFLMKYATAHYSVEAIQLYQYFFGFAATALLIPITKQHRESKITLKDCKDAAPWGILLGVLSAVGGYFVYLSLKTGPFAIVNSINALYLIVTVVVAALLFKEKLTKKRALLVIFAFVALILMQL
jgi:drug/metabolite transporter (DMT)-like permease